MFLTVDVLEVDVLVIDVLELDVLGARRQMHLWADRQIGLIALNETSFGTSDFFACFGT
jgi:hypothetical protein